MIFGFLIFLILLVQSHVGKKNRKELRTGKKLGVGFLASGSLTRCCWLLLFFLLLLLLLLLLFRSVLTKICRTPTASVYMAILQAD